MFKSSLQRSLPDIFLESHPREWVDCSSAAYREKVSDIFLESHPREWVDCSSPAYKDKRPDWFPNPTHGEWVDRSKSSLPRKLPDLFSESHPRDSETNRVACLCRLDLNEPPTPPWVGIQRSQ